VASDYQKLRTARDLAAYRALGHIDAAICYCRQGDAQMALSILLNARATYEASARALENYAISSSGKRNQARRQEAKP